MNTTLAHSVRMDFITVVLRSVVRVTVLSSFAAKVMTPAVLDALGFMAMTVFMPSATAWASTAEPSENFTPSFSLSSQVRSSTCTRSSARWETRLPFTSCM